MVRACRRHLDLHMGAVQTPPIPPSGLLSWGTPLAVKGATIRTRHDIDRCSVYPSQKVSKMVPHFMTI